MVGSASFSFLDPDLSPGSGGDLRGNFSPDLVNDFSITKVQFGHVRSRL